MTSPHGRPILLLLLHFLGLAITSELSAQERQEDTDPLKELTLEQLSQIEIVSVSKEAVPAFQTPAAIMVLTSSEIRRSGARTIPDLLRLIPGVEVGQINSSEWAVGVRGFQGRLSKSMLVLIDGRSVYTPLFAGVYWEMQDVMIEDIDRIEVIRGPGGTIWGSNAVNGVVNIITKSARETRGTLVSAGAGNVEQGFFNWRYGGGTDDLSYRIYGRGFSRGPQYHPDGRNFDDWRKGQAGFRLDWKLSDRDALTIQGDAYTADAGQSLRVNSYSPPQNPIVDDAKRFNGQNVLVTWRRALAGGSDFQLRTYYDRTQREEITYKEVRNTFDADFLHHIPTGRHGISWGIGLRASPSVFSQKAETVDFFPHDQTYRIVSAFLHDDISLIDDRLSLRIGAKMEHTTFSGFNYQPGTRLAWTPSRRQTVWGAVTRAVRAVSHLEEGFNFTALVQPGTPPLFVRLVGDGGFEPEPVIAFAAGSRTYIAERGFVAVSVFHNRHDDLLSVEAQAQETETAPPPARQVLPLLFRNGIVAQTTGGEINSLWDIKDWIRVRGSYSLVRVDARRKATSNDSSTVRQLEGDTPRHKVVLQSAFTLPKDFELNLTYRYVSAVANQLVPAYSTGDFRIGRQLIRGLQLEVVGRDLFQPSHPEYGGSPGALVGIRRSGYIALTWTP